MPSAIVSSRELIETTRGNAALWAACIAGAIPLEDDLAHRACRCWRSSPGKRARPRPCETMLIAPG
jgi:hypothetical protein